MRLWTILMLPAILFVAPVAHGQDSDLDGLPDAREVALGTDIFDRDTDDDGLTDGFEVEGIRLPDAAYPHILWIPSAAAAGQGDLAREADPFRMDTDADPGDERVVINDFRLPGLARPHIFWIPSAAGLGQGPPISELDPRSADTDGDGIQDGTELGVVVGVAPLAGIAGTDPAVFQPDMDPASITDPRLADTDGGGLMDGMEDLDGNGLISDLETDPALAADDHFQLEVLVDVLRQEAHVEIAGARPGFQATVFFSFAGAGRLPVARGVELELAPPVHALAQQHVAWDGTAVWDVPLERHGAAWRAQALEARADLGAIRSSAVVVGSLP